MKGSRAGIIFLLIVTVALGIGAIVIGSQLSQTPDTSPDDTSAFDGTFSCYVSFFPSNSSCTVGSAYTGSYAAPVANNLGSDVNSFCQSLFNSIDSDGSDGTIGVTAGGPTSGALGGSLAGCTVNGTTGVQGSYQCNRVTGGGGCTDNYSSSLSRSAVCGVYQFDVSLNYTCPSTTSTPDPTTTNTVGTPAPTSSGNTGNGSSVTCWCTSPSECSSSGGVEGRIDSGTCGFDACTSGTDQIPCYVPTNDGGGGSDGSVAQPTAEPEPRSYCGESCVSNEECQNVNSASQCIGGTCVNPSCEDSTLPGANCQCEPTYNGVCGQRCGDLPNQPGAFGYCNGGQNVICTFTTGPMCHDQAGGFESYCVPVDDYLPSGYSRPTCQNGDGNSYLSGPGGQTSFTQAEILAMCDASLPEVLYYTRCTDETSDVNRCEIYASIDGTVPVGYYPTPYTSSDEAQVQCDQLSGGDCPGISSASICGDGVINAGEQCDDGNNTNGDNCDESCQREDVVVSAGSNQTPTPNTIGGVNTLADTAIVSDEFDRIIIGLVLVIGGFVTIRLRIFDRFFEEKRFKTIDITK